ncbi:guanylate-binding protein 3-like [Branchiostoma lanceolatum]|uniref:guanylate-binding protein 3-like n=1 Tax=Branchiostoma lanceolatum TaxID=7740 RepID=UPI003454B0F2
MAKSGATGRYHEECLEEEEFKARFQDARSRFSIRKRSPRSDMSGSHASSPANISGLHSKFGFKVEELKPKGGGDAVLGSSIPLILPNDLKYNVSTGKVEKVQGVRRGSLRIVPEALDLLEGIEEPVSVISICGPCRSGKSYILSRLLGSNDAFELGHRMDPQTFGIWMGTKVMRGKDFTIVLLDTEGIDAVGASAGQDASILVMTILLSSQLIYNSLNVPHKGDLEKMQCFVKLAKGITVRKGEGRDVAEFREFFPDFLWLLRDVSLKMEDKDGKDMDPTEYLKKRVLSPDPNEFEQSASDKVGRAILLFFSSVECAILERPSGDKDVMNNIAQKTDSLNPAFNKGVEDLTKRLLLKSRAKRGYDKGSTVSGVALSIMIKQYAEAVNDPNSIPDMDNTWKHTVEIMRKKVIDELVVEYNLEMQTRIAEATGDGQVPIEEAAEDQKNHPTQPGIMNFHHELFKVLTDKLLKKVGHFGSSSETQGTDESDVDVVNQMQNRLVQREERTVMYVAKDGKTYQHKGFEVTGGELLHYIQKNREMSKIFCQELYEGLFDPIRKLVKNPPADYDFDKLIKDLDHATQQYVKDARGPEKWAVLQKMTNSENLKNNFKEIKGYQDKLMKARQKAEEEALAAKEMATEMQEVYKQAQDMQKAQEETMKKMDQQHKEQLKKLQEQEKERREREEQKRRDLMKAKMEEMAEIAKIRNELEESKMREMMKEVQKQNSKKDKQLEEALDKMKKLTRTPPPSPPEPPYEIDGAFWRMFRVFKFW